MTRAHPGIRVITGVDILVFRHSSPAGGNATRHRVAHRPSPRADCRVGFGEIASAIAAAMIRDLRRSSIPRRTQVQQGRVQTAGRPDSRLPTHRPRQPAKSVFRGTAHPARPSSTQVSIGECAVARVSLWEGTAVAVGDSCPLRKSICCVNGGGCEVGAATRATAMNRPWSSPPSASHFQSGGKTDRPGKDVVPMNRSRVCCQLDQALSCRIASTAPTTAAGHVLDENGLAPLNRSAGWQKPQERLGRDDPEWPDCAEPARLPPRNGALCQAAHGLLHRAQSETVSVTR